MAFASRFRHHLLRSGMSAGPGNDAMVVNMFIEGLYDINCQYQAKQTECKSIDEVVRHAEVWEESFRPYLQWPVSYQGAVVMARPNQFPPTTSYVPQPAHYMPPPLSSQMQRMPYTLPGQYMPAPSTAVTTEQYQPLPVPVPTSVFNIDLDQPLTSDMLRDMLGSMESRLNNQVTQYVQTVVNETTPPRAASPSAPKQQPSQQQQRGQQAQGGYNNQQTNKFNQGNGGGAKQKGRFNPNVGYNQQQQQQQYGVVLSAVWWSTIPISATGGRSVSGSGTVRLVQLVCATSATAVNVGTVSAVWWNGSPCGIVSQAYQSHAATGRTSIANQSATTCSGPSSDSVRAATATVTARCRCASRSSIYAERRSEREYQRRHHKGGIGSFGVCCSGP